MSFEESAPGPGSRPNCSSACTLWRLSRPPTSPEQGRACRLCAESMAIFFLFFSPPPSWLPSPGGFCWPCRHHLASCCAFLFQHRDTMLCLLDDARRCTGARSWLIPYRFLSGLVGALRLPGGGACFALLTPFPGDAVRFRPSCSPVNRWIWRLGLITIASGGLCCCPRPLALAGGPAPLFRRWGPEDAKPAAVAAVLGHISGRDAGNTQVNVLIESAAVGRHLAGSLFVLLAAVRPGRQPWAAGAGRRPWWFSASTPA